VRSALPALSGQLLADDELVVVDNASSDGTADAVRELAPKATVIEAGSNLGFASGCNLGAEAASNELLVFLNPDAVPAEGFREAIERPMVEGRGWAAWQGLVTAEGERVINTRGGLVHFTGIAWAGGAGEPLDEAPSTGEPGFASGACLAIPRELFKRLGAFPAEFFLYHEDVDLSLRVRLAGGRLGVEHAARVDHEYEFEKGPAKWRLLERNRWATVIRTYPAGLLALVAPALAATELALIPISIAGGWFRQKVAAWADLLLAARRLRRERREIQATRAVGAREFADGLTPELRSSYLAGAGRSRLLRAALRAYWALVLGLLGSGRA
jgi:GT2 family glycosyltransferase